MSANLIRYLPGGKTVILGVKPMNATPVMPYYRGNPKYKSCATSSQLKNAKELIAIPCCNVRKAKYTIYDGGFATSSYELIFIDDGTGGSLDGGNAYTNFYE